MCKFNFDYSFNFHNVRNALWNSASKFEQLAYEGKKTKRNEIKAGILLSVGYALNDVQKMLANDPTIDPFKLQELFEEAIVREVSKY